MNKQELVHLSQLTLSFDDTPLFERLSTSVHRSEIVALVGANGCGKSTILRILQTEERSRLVGAGLQIDGVIDLIPNTKIARLPQELRTEWPTVPTDQTDYRFEKQRSRLAEELGLTETNKPVGELSDGQLQKLAISSTLATEADLYVLDEPTNYLDIQGILALERALEQLRGRGAAVLLVTHDRALADSLADRTIFLSRDRIYQCHGGFEAVWSLATGDVEARTKQSSDIKRRVDKLQEDVRRRNQWAASKERSKIGAGSAKPSIAKQAAKLAKRSKAVDQRAEREIERLKATKPRVPKRLNLSFPPYQVRHRTAFSFEKVSFSYDQQTDASTDLLRDLTLAASTQDKLCLMGVNGSGKTTLVKLIMGSLSPNSGEAYRHPNLKLTYLPQGLTGFFAEGTLLDNLAHCGDQTTVRQFLGSALIRREKVEKDISEFSPGELMRAALVRCILDQAEFLLLDEPTSHLDIESIQVLEQLLESFPGGYLMISHDRSFVERAASKLYVLQNSRIALA